VREAKVYCRGILSGILGKDAKGYRFTYSPEYLRAAQCPAISLTLPKQKSSFHSRVLFPFFFGLLAEGENKGIQCRLLHIDEQDHFARLLKTCTVETIGGITVEEIA
jgi:serine/threonine-protein kinase HipA